MLAVAQSRGVETPRREPMVDRRGGEAAERGLAAGRRVPSIFGHGDRHEGEAAVAQRRAEQRRVVHVLRQRGMYDAQPRCRRPLQQLEVETLGLDAIPARAHACLVGVERARAHHSLKQLGRVDDEGPLDEQRGPKIRSVALTARWRR